MHGDITIPVAGELRSVATEQIIASTEGIYDYNQQKTQEQLNQEFAEALNSPVVPVTPVDAYTKTESDAKYAAKAASYTKEESDDKYYSKTESDGRYYSKSDSDTKYAEKETVNGLTNTVNEARAAAEGVVQTVTQLGNTTTTLTDRVTTLTNQTNELSARIDEGIESSGAKPTINKTWAEMIALKNSDGFIPGQTYRITDYETIGNIFYGQGVCGYAGHNFDIIVTALTENTLNEQANAVLHEGDAYFANCNLEAWKLMYVLDPTHDERFTVGVSGQIVSSASKGWIYYMEDEHFNSANYDFKNILMEAYKVTDFKYKDYDEDGTGKWAGSPYLKYIGSRSSLQDSAEAAAPDFEEKLAGIYTLDMNDRKLMYLFTYLKEDGTVVDASVEGIPKTTGTEGGNPNTPQYPTYNKMSLLGVGSRAGDFQNGLAPETNLFVCDWEYTTKYGAAPPAHNEFGQRCFGLTFGNGCFDNSFEDWQNACVFGNAFTGNYFNYNCTSVVTGNYVYWNNIGSKITKIKVGNEFSHNQIFYAGNIVADNLFKQNRLFRAQYIVAGEDCSYNVFENANYITVGDSCWQNRFHPNSNYITMGDNCRNNTFNGSNAHVAMGDGCQANTFGNMCRYIVFGTSEEDLKGYYTAVEVDSYNDHIAINCTATTSESNRLIGIKVDSRINSPYLDDTSIDASTVPYKIINVEETEQEYKTTYSNSNARIVNV